jgi:hypothetical protein
MSNRVGLLALLLVPTVARADGVVVGHPVNLRFGAGTGLSYTSGSISVTDQVVEFCTGSPLTMEIDDVVAIGDPVLLPVGTICAVELYLDAPVLLDGTGNGGSFELALELSVIRIEVDPPLVVTQSGSTGTSDATAVELAYPDWITSASLQLSTNVHRVIDSQHASHDTLKARVRDDSSVVIP